MSSEFNLNDFLMKAHKANASDLHFREGKAPALRIDGKIMRTAMPLLSEDDFENILFQIAKKDILENVTQKAHKLINLNGFETVSESQIIPIIIGNNEKTLNVSENLKSQGYYIPAIRPPTVPEGTSRLRISLTADSRVEDFEKILEIVKS